MYIIKNKEKIGVKDIFTGLQYKVSNENWVCIPATPARRAMRTLTTRIVTKKRPNPRLNPWPRFHTIQASQANGTRRTGRSQ